MLSNDIGEPVPYFNIFLKKKSVSLEGSFITLIKEWKASLKMKVSKRSKT